VTGRPDENNEAIALTVAVLVIAGIAAGLAVAQYVLYRQERTALAVRLEQSGKQLRALEVVTRKRAEFDRGAALLAEKLEQVRYILPEELDVTSFMAMFTRLALSEGVSIDRRESEEEQTEGALQSAPIHLELRGRPASLESLRTRTLRMARVIHWQEEGRGPQGASVLITIFASPSSAPTRAETNCSPGVSGVWLWPWKARLVGPRGELSRLCAEIESHVETARRIDAYQAGRSDLEKLIARVERLKAEQEGKPVEAAGSRSR
jgi:Tfp pilus assembly protein PilO